MVHFQKVQPGRDYGTTLEILHGLAGLGEEVVVNPGDAVKEGAMVQITAAKTDLRGARRRLTAMRFRPRGITEAGPRRRIASRTKPT